jgi:hypothetical protein
MHKKIKFIHSLLIFSTLMLLSGCLNYEQDVKLKIDGSGSMKIHYWIQLNNSDSSKFISQVGIFNADSLKEEFKSKFAKIEKIAVYADTTDSTYHAKIEFSFDKIDSLNTMKPFVDSRFSFHEGAANQIVFSQFIPPISPAFGYEGSKYKVTYKYEFPGEILVHNATEAHNNKLTWSYNLSDIGKGKTLSVTFTPYKLKETPTWIFVFSGSVLAFVIFFLLKKKKN